MHRARILLLAVLAVASGCAESGPGGTTDPLGTFCVDVEGADAETCLDADTLHAYRTTASGKVWFQVGGTIDVPVQDTYSGETTTVTEPVTIFGELPEGCALPRPAENTAILLPVLGRCVKTVRISPFGSCDTLERVTVCPAESIYRDDLTTVTVEAMTDETILLSFTTTIGIDDMHICCADEPDYCAVGDPATFTPPGPFGLTGHIHAAFTE